MIEYMLVHQRLTSATTTDKSEFLQSEHQRKPRIYLWIKSHLREHQPQPGCMIQKIDITEGLRDYSKRLGAIEDDSN